MVFGMVPCRMFVITCIILFVQNLFKTFKTLFKSIQELDSFLQEEYKSISF